MMGISFWYKIFVLRRRGEDFFVLERGKTSISIFPTPIADALSFFLG